MLEQLFKIWHIKGNSIKVIKMSFLQGSMWSTIETGRGMMNYSLRQNFCFHDIKYDFNIILIVLLAMLP
jgi:hypothetical protein